MIQTVIAANRSRWGDDPVGRANQGSNDGNHFRPFQNQREYRPAGNVAFQAGIKRLANMFLIMPLRQFRRDGKHFHRGNRQSLAFESRKNLAGELPGNSVRLQQNKCFFHRVISIIVTKIQLRDDGESSIQPSRILVDLSENSSSRLKQNVCLSVTFSIAPPFLFAFPSRSGKRERLI